MVPLGEPVEGSHRWIPTLPATGRAGISRLRRALAAQHLTMDAPADAPIEEGKPYVDGNGSLPAGLLDQGTDLDQQFVGFLVLQIQNSCSSLPFWPSQSSRMPG
jgi:hypothetical protein